MFARTPRLLLRPGWAEDAPALAAAIGEEAVVRNLARAPWPYGLPEARAYCESGFDAALPSFFILERAPASPRLIGGIGLGRTPEGEVEFGYWLARAAWGRGYATEAGRAVLELARNGLRLSRIVSGHFLDNPASGRVLEKLGFIASPETGLRHSLARGCDVPFRGYALDLAATGAADGGTRAIAA